MDYGDSDSSGTADDLPPHSSRMQRGRVSGNGKAVVQEIQFGRSHNDMESQIHCFAREAYSAVLRAFNSQSDVITWAKESLMTELRKELRVSDEEHRELLGKVNADGVLRQIREWRQSCSYQPVFTGNAVHAPGPTHSPTVSVSQKKQKTTHVMPSVHLQPPPNRHHSPVPSSSVPFAATSKQGDPLGVRGRKSKDHSQLVVHTVVKRRPVPPAVPASAMEQNVNKRPPGRPPGKSHSAVVGNVDPLIGRKVMTRWPQDNNFYEAIITDFNPEKGTHALVYDMNTPEETWEWVNIKEISPADIRWDGAPPEGFGQGVGNGIKNSVGYGGISHSNKGRAVLKGQSIIDSAPSQNGIGRRDPEDIELRYTDKLIMKVQRLVEVSNPDPADLEKAKKVLKEHEFFLLEAIDRLPGVSDEDGRNPRSRTHSVDDSRVRKTNRNTHASADEYDTEEDGRGEGSDGEPFVGEGGVASDNIQDGYDADEYG